MNFLEQLAAEWYEYSGYFVRTNVRTRKRAKGGWDVELDALAYAPSHKELVHIEASGDANSWGERRERFLRRKFVLTVHEYEELLGCEIARLRRIALVGWTRSTKADLNWGQGIEVQLIPDFLQEIAATLRDRDPMRQAVPEGYPLLRSMQMVIGYCSDLET